MADPPQPQKPQNGERWNVTLPDTSLVIEDEPARLRQAQFTRLQMALGLKEEKTAEDLKKYKYGDDLPAIDADRATGFKRKGDVFVCDLSLAVHRDSTDAITAIYMNTAIFHTENFWNAPPEDFTVRAKDSSHAISTENLVDGTISERQLGGFRFMLYNFLEPLCTDRDKSVVWLLHTADIFDLRELNEAYLTRCNGNARGPETGGQRTRIPQSDRLSTVDEILKARGCVSSNDKARSLSREMIKATVKMASDDAASPAWVRTREQVDGGDFSQPRKLRSRDDVFDFLIDHDIDTPQVLSKQALKSAVAREKRRCEQLPDKEMVAIAVDRAQRHNYPSLLRGYVGRPSLKKQTAQTIELVRIAREEMRPIPANSSTSDDTPPTAAANTTGTSGIAAAMSSIHHSLRKDETLPSDLAELCGTYGSAGCEITTRLVTFLKLQLDYWNVTEARRIGLQWPIEDGEYCWESCSAFERTARKARQSGWIMDDEVASLFITAITARRELRGWYDRLPSNDSRFPSNVNHEAWLKTLVRVAIILAGHQ